MQFTSSIAQVVTKQVIIPAAVINEKTNLRTIDSRVTPEFKVTVSTWSAGKISASQALISYSVRIDDAIQPMKHGVVFNKTCQH